MKKYAAVLTAFLLVFGCAGFAACAPDQPEADIAAQSVTLDETQLTLTVGESATLTATVLPDNTTDKTVAWSASDEIVTVSGGKVTALAEGSATVRAACGSAFAECEVTVMPAYGPVTAQEWEAAFNFAAMEDFSLTLHTVLEAEGIDLNLIEYTAADGRERLVSRIEGEAIAYMERTAESSGNAYKVYAREDGPWSVYGADESLYEANVSETMSDMFASIIHGYETFEDGYDEAQRCYRRSITMYETTLDAVLRFAGGKLRSLVLDSGGGSQELTIVYGGQSVQLPDERVTQQTWTAAFDFDAYDNFQLTLVHGASPEEQKKQQFVYIVAEGKAYLNGNPNGTFMNAYAQRNADGAWQVYEQNATSSAWVLTRTQAQSLYASDSGVKPIADALAAAFADFVYEELAYHGAVTVEGETVSYTVSIIEGRIVQIDWQGGWSLEVEYGEQEVTFPFETE